MKIVFMGTPDFAVPVLEALIDDGYAVQGVYIKPDKPTGRGQELSISAVKAAAQARGLRIFQPRSLRSQDDVSALSTLVPDMIVVAAFGLILPREILSLPAYKCLNVHPSLLPRHRGPSPVTAAILAGDEVTGVSIMLMDEGTDTGPVLARQEERIHPEDTTGSLSARLAKTGAELLLRTIPLWVAGETKPEPQDESRSTYSRTLKKEDGLIDWTQSAVVIERQVRAYQPWPGSYTFWKGKRLKIIKATVVEGAAGGGPGLVVPGPSAGDAAMGVRARPAPAVVTGKGLLVLDRVQLEGKREVPGEEFILGQRDLVGGIFVASTAKNAKIVS